jgi:hypothetical protein
MTAVRTSEDDLRAYFALLPKEVASELTPVRASKMAFPYLYHISKDTKIERFAPTVTKRSLDGEDRSVPRICTAPSLAGCILGYASDLHDFMNRPTCMSGDGERKVKFAGGWAIYGIPFEFALVPSKKLLPDVAKTQEHWLVNYSPERVTYEAELLGKFYYESVMHLAGKGEPATVIEMVVEVLTETPIVFDRKTTLTKGYWKLTVAGMHQSERWDKIPVVKREPMEEKSYTASKQLIASFLSFEQYAPPSAAW